MTSRRTIRALGFVAIAGTLIVGCGDGSPTDPEPEPKSVDVSNPTIPLLIAPAEGAVMDNGCVDRSDGIVWEFDWSDVDGPAAYHLFVMGQNATFPVIDLAVGESRFRHESPGSYIISRHQRGWRWRVRARIGEEWMDWSPERTFDVEPLNSDCL
jgi:hypothetical protein